MPHLSVRPSLRLRLVRSFSVLLSLSLILPNFIAPATAQRRVRQRVPVNNQSQSNQSQSNQPSNDALARRAKNPEFVPGEVLVRFRDDVMPKAKSGKFKVNLAADYSDAGDSLKGEILATIENTEGAEIISGLRLARVDAEDTLTAIKRFNERDDVLYAEPNYIYRVSAMPNDTRYSSLYAFKNTGQSGGTIGADIDAELAWDRTTGSRNVVIGVIDEGVDIDHPDLQPNIWRNPGEVAGNGIDDDGNGKVDDVSGWDFVDDDNNVRPNTPSEFHGTHVTGIVGARGNNGVGVTGVNWQVSLLPLRSGDDDGLPGSALLGAYAYAKTMRDLWESSGGTRGANIRALNNSYGGPGFSQSAFNAIQALSDSGVLFVAAAGNDNTDNDVYPSYPTNFVIPNVISVAATDRFDGLASFSQFGARTVSMGAPGVSILSTYPTTVNSTTGATIANYATISGTSMATPMVAGAAGLVCAANPNISMANLRGVLLYNGDRVDSLKGKTSTGRRLNVYNSVLAAFENDVTAPASVGDLRVASINGRRVTLDFTAPGDDGNTGQAADYNILFRDDADGTETLLPLSLLPSPAGTPQSASVNIPYRRLRGTLLLRVIDNVGNTSTTPVNIALSAQASGNDPYVQTVSSAVESVSIGGTALNLRSDDAYRQNYALPFAFPFYGQLRTSVTISTNGALYFNPAPPDGINDAGSGVPVLNTFMMIAGMWDDIRTDGGVLNPASRTTDDVYIVQPNADTIIFRWQGVTFDTPLSASTSRGENPIEFEIELRRDGNIKVRYGAGNTRLTPVVGISGGEPEAYVVTQYTAKNRLINLTNAATVTFAPRRQRVRKVVPRFRRIKR